MIDRTPPTALGRLQDSLNRCAHENVESRHTGQPGGAALNGGLQRRRSQMDREESSEAEPLAEAFKVGVVGAGYVGLVTGACLAYVGHEVTCVDRDEARIVGLRGRANRRVVNVSTGSETAV